MRTFSGFSELQLLGLSGSNGIDFNGTHLDQEGFRIPDKVKESLKLKTFKSNKIKNKQFTMNGYNIKPTERDLWEFNVWLKSKSKIKPQLRNQFQTDEEYEDFMIKDQKENINIKNDPSIIGNSNKVHVSKEQERGLSKNDIVIHNLQTPEDNEEDIKPTDRDLWEFHIWIKNESSGVKPKLLSKFKNDQEYKNFMINEWDKVLAKNKQDHSRKLSENLAMQIGNMDGIKNLFDQDEKDDRIKLIDGEWRILNAEGVPWPQKYDSEESAKDAFKHSRLYREYHKDGSETRIFKGFGFENIEDAGAGTINYGSVIGTLVLSESYIRLFQFIDNEQFPAHLALNNLPDRIGDKIIGLARHILAFHEVDQFINVILPGNCPLNYLERLHTFCSRVKVELFNKPEDSGFVSQLDDISNELAEAIYRLKRLKIGYKWFSEADDEEKTPNKIGNAVNKIKQLPKTALKTAAKYGKAAAGSLTGGYAFKNSLNYSDEDQIAFSEIKSDDAFRKYIHSVMKNAHGNKYSEKITNKLVDDLLKSPHKDYGELIGRATSGLGNK